MLSPLLVSMTKDFQELTDAFDPQIIDSFEVA